MNPKTELEKRYPHADFWEYFCFLQKCIETEKGSTQEHHICPRKQFPEFIDSPENVMTLRVADHAHAHRLLEAACGIKAPSTALFEKSLAAALEGGKHGSSAGGKIGGRISGRMNVESGHLARIRTPEHQVAAGRAGGKASVSARTAEQTAALCLRFAAVMKYGLHTRWHVNRSIVSSSCVLCCPQPRRCDTIEP